MMRSEVSKILSGLVALQRDPTPYEKIALDLLYLAEIDDWLGTNFMDRAVWRYTMAMVVQAYVEWMHGLREVVVIGKMDFV
jgi:hypothetical protein